MMIYMNKKEKSKRLTPFIFLFNNNTIKVYMITLTHKTIFFQCCKFIYNQLENALAIFKRLCYNFLYIK